MHDLGHNEELSKSRSSDLAFTVFTTVNTHALPRLLFFCVQKTSGAPPDRRL